MKTKKKILFLQNKILHYNKPLYNFLSDIYDVTILHSGSTSINSNDTYKEIIVNMKKFGPFIFQYSVIKEVLSSKYDVVISMFDIKWINNILALYLKSKNVKYIWWGIGYGKNKIGNIARNILVNKSDGLILYSNRDLDKFISAVKDKGKIVIANNTYYVKNPIKSYEHEKEYLLFVGSLDERKELNIVLKALKNTIKKIPEDIKFIIIGEGKEKEKLINYVEKENLINKVIFKGRIADNSILKEYYKNAIISISFGQAGLSVLQSFAYGVAFLTKKNAISGGEITNIIHNKTGILCEDNIKSLEDNLIYLCNNKAYSKELGKNAYEYYQNNATMREMVNNFIKMIEGK
jgi:glycosyltransferase involved in cell wall biosynthesis